VAEAGFISKVKYLQRRIRRKGEKKRENRHLEVSMPIRVGKKKKKKLNEGGEPTRESTKKNRSKELRGGRREKRMQ